MSYITKVFDDKVIELLKNGGVGLLPTDTIYGLSASVLQHLAIDKIFGLKARESGKSFIVLVANFEQLRALGIDESQAQELVKYWPAPLTVILDVDDTCPDYLSASDGTLAVRMPAHEQLKDLISKTGPIVSTSANTQGMPPAHNLTEAQEYFKDKLDFYVDVGDVRGEPSTIARLQSDTLSILRQGSFFINS